MTMISPERASATNAANRLVELSIAHKASDVSDRIQIEEKKTQEVEDYFAMSKGKEKLAVETPKSTCVDAFATNTMQPIFRNHISNEPGFRFLPQKGRYVLYVSKACPASHQLLLIRTMKGLEDTISVKYAHLKTTPALSTSNTCGNRMWVISHEIPDDSLASFKSDEGEFATIRDIYKKENDKSTNSIPLLYDQEHHCIVNNDADDIARMLNVSFSEFCEHPNVDLLPDLSPMKEELEQWLYPLLHLSPSNMPPYRYGLSARELEYAFDRATCILQKQRYLLSHTAITDADLRLFVVLVRYDAVYAKYLESPLALLHNPALLDYCRDIYQQPGVAETVCMDEIRAHFLGGRNDDPRINHYGILDKPDALVELLQVPNKRELL